MNLDTGQRRYALGGVEVPHVVCPSLISTTLPERKMLTAKPDCDHLAVVVDLDIHIARVVDCAAIPVVPTRFRERLLPGPPDIVSHSAVNSRRNPVPVINSRTIRFASAVGVARRV